MALLDALKRIRSRGGEDRRTRQEAEHEAAVEQLADSIVKRVADSVSEQYASDVEVDERQAKESEYRRANWIVGPGNSGPMVWAEFNDASDLEAREPALTASERAYLRDHFSEMPSTLFPLGWFFAVRRPLDSQDTPTFFLPNDELGVWAINNEDIEKAFLPEDQQAISLFLSPLKPSEVPDGCVIIVSNPSSE